MSLSRILSRITAAAVIASVGFGAMFVSIDAPADSSAGNTASTMIRVPTTFAADVTPGTSAPLDGKSTDTPASTQKKKDTIEEWGDQIVKAANFGLEILYAFLIPLTLLAGWLLSPDWTFGDIFGLRTVIHSLWVLISNIVYVIFAFALVAIAFVNIYSGGGNFAIKKALPRFLVGIIIVPFTWFIVSATLSVSNLLTASVLRLPYDMMTTEQRSYELKIPKTCTLKFDQTDTTSAGKIFTCGEEMNPIKLGDFISGGKSAYNLVTAYAYSVFSIDTLKKISGKKLQTLQSILNGGIQLIVGIVSFFVFAILLLALCFALFTRAFYMWIMAIFSPLFGLFYFFDGKMAGAKKIEDKIGFTKFVGLAMVPVYVSAALSFGLLFLTMTQNVDLSKDIAEKSSYWQNVDGDKTQTTFSIWQMSNGKPVMDVKVEGQPLYVEDAVNGAQAGVKLGQNAIGKIIISLLGIVVLWMAVMGALNSSTITESAVKPIGEFGKSIADMAKAIPSHIPLIPVPWQKPTSISGLQEIWRSIKSAVDSAGMQNAQAIGSSLGASIAGPLGGLNEQQREISNALNLMSVDRTKVPSTLDSILKANHINDIDDIRWNNKAQENLTEWVNKIPKEAFDRPNDTAGIATAKNEFISEFKGHPSAALAKLNTKLDPNIRLKNGNTAITTENGIETYVHNLAAQNAAATTAGGATAAGTTTALPRTAEELMQALPGSISAGTPSISGVNGAASQFTIAQDPNNIARKMTAEAEFNRLATHLGVSDAEKGNLKTALQRRGVDVI